MSNTINSLYVRQLVRISLHVFIFYVLFRNQPVTILEEEKKSDDEDDVPAWKKQKL